MSPTNCLVLDDTANVDEETQDPRADPYFVEDSQSENTNLLKSRSSLVLLETEVRIASPFPSSKGSLDLFFHFFDKINFFSTSYVCLVF